jgi:exodeoxyribonuclease V alpha subunit
LIELKCTVEHITFRNDSNGFTVFSVREGRRKTTAVGNIAEVHRGMQLTLNGEFVMNPRFGEQFRVAGYSVRVPTGSEEIVDFLGSGVIAGIGPKTAVDIESRFGADSLRMIEEEPERLLEISGIGKKKLETIKNSFALQKDMVETSLFLSSLGLSASASAKVQKEYGADTKKLIEANPYRLVRAVRGVSFREVDAIAARIGIVEDSEERIKAGVLYVLEGAVNEGSTFLPEEEFMDKVNSLIGVMREQVEDIFFDLILEGFAEKAEVDGAMGYFLADYFLAEKSVANDLRRLSEAELKPLGSDIESLIASVERESGLIFSAEQKNAIAAATSGGVFVVTGGPGTGKTTIIQAIADVLTSHGLVLEIVAPTGRAAKRITEKTGYEAKTIHRLLEYSADPESDEMYFGRDASNPVEADALIVDEASMIDVLLMEALLDALKTGVRLVVVGDSDQLPPVGAGNVLRDILASERMDYAKLTEIYRQATESLIVMNAHRINRGENPVLNEDGGNFFFNRKPDEQSALNTILDLCAERLPAYLGAESGGTGGIQVITPVKRGRLGSINLNEELQARLNPEDEFKEEMTAGGVMFREGDRVMQTKNDYEAKWVNILGQSEGRGIFNGDLGVIEAIDENKGGLSVIFDGERKVRYSREAAEDLDLAYAVTVHKSQGSEYPAVVMPMMFVPPMLATRNLLYTAVTRGRELVVLVGGERYMLDMIERVGSRDRYSALAGFLRALP